MKKMELSIRLGLASVIMWLSSSCTSLSKHTPPFRPPPVETRQLSNGLTMMVLKDSSLPRFQLNLIMKMGSRLDPKGQEGLNHLFFSLLDQGTKTRSAEKIAQELNQLGTEISQGAGTDTSFVSVAGLKVFQDSILEIFSDVIFHPSFEPAEVDRVRRLNISSLQKILDSPPSYASAKMDELLYQNHPYARSSVGSSE
ncbi:MAG: insulinase family protein, partial [Bdellovibrio sp.]